jgi:lipase chaperone LimK
MNLTARILSRLERDFKASERDRARYIIESVDIGDDETEGSERIQTAMLMLANGNLDRLLEAAVLTETDWRDLLVDADLADDDWRPKADAYLTS